VHPRVSRLRVLTVATLLGLCVLVALAVTGAIDGMGGRVIAVAIGELPLLLCLPGLLRLRAASLSWLAFVLVPYCGLGIVETMAAFSWASAGLLLAALLNLGLVLSLSRAVRR
jgi:uncharacterized membrane protein